MYTYGLRYIIQCVFWKYPVLCFVKFTSINKIDLVHFRPVPQKLLTPPPLSFTWGDMKFTKIHFYKLQFTLIFFIKFYCKAIQIFSRLLLYQHRQYTHQYNLYKTWVQSNEIRQKKTNFSKGLRLCLTPIVLNLRRQVEWLKQNKMIIKSHTKLLQFQNYQC